LLQHSTRRWARYTLSAVPETPASRNGQTAEEKVLAYVQAHGSINNAECRDLLGIESRQATYLLNKLQAQGRLVRTGERRWIRYRLP